MTFIRLCKFFSSLFSFMCPFGSNEFVHHSLYKLNRAWMKLYVVRCCAVVLAVPTVVITDGLRWRLAQSCITKIVKFSGTQIATR